VLCGFDVVLFGGVVVVLVLFDCVLLFGVCVVMIYGMSEMCGGCVYDGVLFDGVYFEVGECIWFGGVVVVCGYCLLLDLF